MKLNRNLFLVLVLAVGLWSCQNKPSEKEKPEEGSNEMKEKKEKTAADILGNPDYQAISFGGYRNVDHDIEPTVEELKEDMRLLHAMGIRMLRTYKVHRPHAANVLQAISELKAENENFEMYVMLGAWIDCKDARTENPDHDAESEENKPEIEEAARLANKYPDIVKVVAVGNEAMVKWAASYYVQPAVILKWVRHLQDMKAQGQLPKDLWITSSDDFSSWGGGGKEYHTPELEQLYQAVDYISMHTYPYHNTHYNPEFWIKPDQPDKGDREKVEAAMLRALEFAQAQYDSVSNYMKSIGVNKPVHIGETGWATESDGFYGPTGSRATDELKDALYYKHMREWTNEKGISCFYFEAFDEPWKDAKNPNGSENHFGLFTKEGQAKYVIWDLVDQGTFDGLGRNGQPVSKTFDGDEAEMMKTVLAPPVSE